MQWGNRAHCTCVPAWLCLWYSLILQGATLPEMLRTPTNMPEPQWAGPRSCLLLWCWWASTPKETAASCDPLLKELARASTIAVLTLKVTHAFLSSLTNNRFIQSTLLITCKSRSCLILCHSKFNQVKHVRLGWSLHSLAAGCGFVTLIE